MYTFKVSIIFFIFISFNYLYSFPIYEKFYPQAWKDLNKDQYLKPEDEFDWNGPPLIFFKREWKEHQIIEYDILLTSYTETKDFIKWEFPITTRFLIFPFSLISYLKSKKDNRLMFFSPLYIRKRIYDDDFHFYWLGFYNQEKDYSKHCLIVPIICVNDSNQEISHYFFPIYYYSKNKYTNAKNFIFPILWYKSNEYFHFIPVFFSTKESITKNNESVSTYTKWWTFLFVFHWSQYYDKRTNSISTDSVSLFPIFEIDFYDCSSISFNIIRYCPDEQYKRIFPLFWHKSDDYLTIFPILWYKANEYLHILPLFYWQKSYLTEKNKAEQNDLSYQPTYTSLFISPFFVKKEDKNKRSLWRWILFLYFDWEKINDISKNETSINEKTNREMNQTLVNYNIININKKNNIDEIYMDSTNDLSQNNVTIKGNSLFPLWYYNNYNANDPNSKHYIFISPIYFQYKDSNKNKQYLWSLIYYQWENSKSNGFVFFPFRFYYKDEQKVWDLWIAYNIREESVYIKNQSLYLDIDHTFLYNVFSFSARKKITLLTNQQNTSSDSNIKEKETKDNTIVITKDYDPFNRDFSDNFISLTFFFGWIRYIDSYSYTSKSLNAQENSSVVILQEKNNLNASQKDVPKVELIRWKHFRILPLTWLSWQPESNNKVQFWFALGLWYEDQTQEKPIKYKALFPFFIPLYGYFQKDKDYTEFYVFNFYVKSYTENNHYTETSYFWPISKVYDSDTEKGHYIFPFYTHKKTIETQDNKQIETSRNYSLIHYYKKKTETIENNIISEKSILWLLLLLLLYRKSYEKTIYEESTFNIVFPFLYINNDKRMDSDNTSYRRNWHYIFPIFFYEKFQDFKKQNDINHTYVVFPIIRIDDHDCSGISFNIIRYCSNEKYKRFFPIVWYKDNSYFYIFPLFFSFRGTISDQNNESSFTYTKWWSFLLLFHWKKYYNKYTNTINDDSVLLFPIFKIDYDDCSGISLNIIRYCPNEKYKRLFPIYWHKSDEYLHFLPLLSIYYKKKNFHELYIYPLLTKYENLEDFNVFFYLLGHRKIYSKDYYHYNVTPLFWSYKNKDYYFNMFLPFYIYNKNDYSNDESLFIFPTLSYRSKTKYSDYNKIFYCQLLCLLYYRNENQEIDNDYYLPGSFLMENNKVDGSKEIWGLWRLLF